MNYDEARQLSEGGGWHWTTKNDGVVRTAQPCVTILRPFDPLNPFAPLRPGDVKRCEPHATREEAERHYYDWSLGNLAEAEFQSAEKCEAGCGTWTNRALGNSGLIGYFRSVFLCDFHRRPDVVAELRPFEPGISVVHS